MNDVFYFGCWNEPGHFLYATSGAKYWRSDGIDHYVSALGERRHIDGSLAPRKVARSRGGDRTGAIVFDGMLKKDVSYDYSVECPEGQFLRHELSNGFTAIAWWDRNQGDRRGACNSALLARGVHTSEQMLALLAKHFPSVLGNLKKAGIELVEVLVS